MKLAYVITAHKDPGQLLRLLRAIDDPGNTYVLHIDSKSDRSLHDAARGFADANASASVIASENIIWGSWRLAHAQIRGMEQALRVSRDWDYCINLTAQDYPLRTQSHIAAALAAGPPKANYLEVLDFAQAGANPRKRLEYFWYPWRGKMKKLIRRRALKFKVYWGSNYFALTRSASEHLAGSEVSRRMQRCFRFTLCADELIFQNAIMHGPAELRDSIINRTFRKLVWAGGSHPKTFTMADREELLSSDAWFARKFDPAVDAEILDVLDEHLAAQRVHSSVQ